MKHVFSLALICSLGACSVVPEPFQASSNTNLVPFEQIINEPVGLVKSGQMARWGGQIVSIENKENISEIEVVYFPEASNGKPKVDWQSAGRFKVKIDGNIDSTQYTPNSIITVLGEVSAPQAGTIGEHEYVYPTLLASNYHVWANPQAVDTDNIGTTQDMWASRKHDVEGPLYGPNRSKLNKR